MQLHLAVRVLVAIFVGHSRSLPVTRAGLARSSGLDARELERALAELERSGWLDASRLRLTLPGLAVAAACAAEARARRRERSSTRKRLARHDLAA